MEKPCKMSPKSAKNIIFARFLHPRSMSTGWSSTKPIYLNPMSFSRNLDTHVDPDSVLIVDWNKFEVEIPLWQVWLQ